MLDIEVMEAMIENFKNFAIVFNNENMLRMWLNENASYMFDAGVRYDPIGKYFQYRKTYLRIITGNSHEILIERMQGCTFDKIFWRIDGD